LTTGQYSLGGVGDVGAVPGVAQSGLGVSPDARLMYTITGMGCRGERPASSKCILLSSGFEDMP